jgi:signal transduction histidine kinase
MLQEAARSEREAMEALKTAQARLMESEKLASLGQLVAGVAHEINNPLAFVANNHAVLARDIVMLRELLDLYRSAEPILATVDPALAARITETAERIDVQYTLDNLTGLLSRSRDGLKRIQQIVLDLREFSRHDTSGDEPELADLNVGLQSTANIVHGRAASRQIDVQLELSPLPRVLCYAARINQVILNLLANAIDACPGGGHVTLRSRAVEGGVELEVDDTGCGIDPAIVGKIFDPFFTTKPQGHGTGMGLSISYGIVADHGGKISVNSTPGRGTRFTVFLPLKSPDAIDLART